MPYDVFISYSSSDKSVADTICSILERNEIRCWIAPRDIFPGENFATSIIKGIDACYFLVLVFSESANKSKHVLREVDRAIAKEKTILSFRIQNTLPSDAMEYYLSVPHWFDALTEPLEKHIKQLVQTVNTILLPYAESNHNKTDNQCNITTSNHKNSSTAINKVAEIKSYKPQFSGINITLASDEKQPFPVEYIVQEEDSFQVLSADIKLQLTDDHPIRVMTDLYNYKEKDLGTIVFRDRRILAIVHDLNQNPSCWEDSVREALNTVLHKTEQLKIKALGMQLLGSVFGSIPQTRCLYLIGRALETVPLQHLKQVWVITPKQYQNQLEQVLEQWNNRCT